MNRKGVQLGPAVRRGRVLAVGASRGLRFAKEICVRRRIVSFKVGHQSQDSKTRYRFVN
jgi:hypothetical protein